MADARIQQLVQEGHPEHSARIIAQLETERDDALKMAEQTVLDAINVLQSFWSVPCKIDALITIHDHILSQQVRSNNNRQDRDQAGVGSAALVHTGQGDQHHWSIYGDANCSSNANQLGQGSRNTHVWKLKSFERLRSFVLELHLILALHFRIPEEPIC